MSIEPKVALDIMIEAGEKVPWWTMERGLAKQKDIVIAACQALVDAGYEVKKKGVN